jgi:hypothetical protein
MEDEEYHRTKRWSSSIFKKHLIEHPIRAIQELNKTEEDREDDEKKKALRTGKIFHMLLLEPEKFDQLATVAPKLDRRKTEDKAKWAAFQSSIPPGGFLLDQEELEQFKAMRAACDSQPFWHPSVKANFGYVYEVPGFAMYNGNLPLKIKPDVRSTACPLMLDLKSCDDVLDFPSGIDNHNYMVQAAYYCIVAELIDGSPHFDWRWLAVSKRAPFEAVEWRAPISGDCGLIAWKHFLRMEMDELSKRIADKDFPKFPAVLEYEPKPYMNPERQITGGFRPWQTK